jgi:cystathionine gamma-synthase
MWRQSYCEIDLIRRLARRCETSDSIDEVLYSGKTGMLSLRLNKAYSVVLF